MERSTRTIVSEVNKKSFWPVVKACEIIVSQKSIVHEGANVKGTIGNLHFIYGLFCKSKTEQKVCQIIADSIVFYEKKSPGAGLVLAAMIAESFRQLDGNSCRVDFDSAMKAAAFGISDRIAESIFLQSLSIVGADSKISIVRQPIEKPIIKLKTKPEVRIRIHENFAGKCLKLPQEISDVNFFMVNGAVAKASELEYLFSLSSSSNSHYILVSKSFNQEVLDVLSMNYMAGKLKIIPAEIGFDLDSINSLPDLVGVVGGLPLSSDMGDVISGSHSDRFGYAEKVIIGRDFMQFYGKCAGNVDVQIARIKAKIEDTSSQDKKELLTTRLSALTGNSCEIILPRKDSFSETGKQLGNAYSVLKFCCAYLCNKVAIGETQEIFLPRVSIDIAAERFKEIEKIMLSTNQAVIRDEPNQ